MKLCGKTFIVIVKTKELENKINVSKIKSEVELASEEKKKAFVRGLFLGSGSINNPENEYHLEVILTEEENLDFAIMLLKELGVTAKKMVTKNKFSFYIKDGEEISMFLALIGANKAVMQFEDIRIQREMRGKVNRLVNCEAANLNKTINAAVEQISAIEKLQKTGEFNKLDDNLKEIAILRLENPELPLIELGKMLKEPVGKSGVNYRLKKIVDLAKENK